MSHIRYHLLLCSHCSIPLLPYSLANKESHSSTPHPKWRKWCVTLKAFMGMFAYITRQLAEFVIGNTETTACLITERELALSDGEKVTVIDKREYQNLLHSK